MVSSANQRVGMKVILGLSQLFIRMGLSGFNAVLNLKDLTSEESHLFLTKSLNLSMVFFMWHLPLPYNTYSLHMLNKLFSSLLFLS